MNLHGALSSPAFGEADLSNCEREQIHLAGSIQPHGALLVVRESDFVVLQASANAQAFLAMAGPPVGQPLAALGGDLAARVGDELVRPLDEIAVAVRCRAGAKNEPFDGLVHRPQSGGLVIELERAGPSVDLSRHVERAVDAMVGCSSIESLAEEAARLFKDLTGYDRVMVYRFDDDGHGQVFAERREPTLEPFLGNRYPSSDIPQIARRLYLRNRVRVLVDVTFEPAPVEPAKVKGLGELDMSLCFLRASSPIHVQYLKNMGVCGTLVVSIVVGGKLWGLISCHHYAPRFIHYEMRAVCELLAESMATRIAALESFAQAQAELSVRRLEQRMIESIQRDGDWRRALFDGSRGILQILDATGAALVLDDQILTAGEVPGTPDLRRITQWLNEQPREPVIGTAALGEALPELASLAPLASGVLATPLSTAPSEYLMWMRPEQIRTVTWGGDPRKAVVVGNDPSQLSPRRSFAQWHEVVEGTCPPWTDADVTTARLVGASVADVILQFRSVRMLLARDQLDAVRRQVHVAEQPVVIADRDGNVVHVNGAFTRLAGSRAPAIDSLDALANLFADPARVAADLSGLLARGRHWRGELALGAATANPSVTLLVRADPVFTSPDRVLGFVLLFTDLTESKAADAARRRFQDEVVEQRHVMTRPLDSQADLEYRNLLSAIVENAQLAALEITDGGDIVGMPERLESIRASVIRTAELLEYVIQHARRSGR